MICHKELRGPHEIMADQLILPRPPATGGNRRCPAWIAADSPPAADGAAAAAASGSGSPGGTWRDPKKSTSGWGMATPV